MSWLVTNIKLNKVEWFSVVDKGASGDKKNRAKIVLWKRQKPSIKDRLRSIFSKGTEPKQIKKQESTTMTLEEILAALPEDQKAVILAALEAAAKQTPAPMPVAAQDDEKKEEELQKRLAEAIEKLPEELRVTLEKRLDAEDEVKKTEKEKLELIKRVEELEETQRMIELKKRAEDLGFLPMSTLDLAKTLGAADRSMDDDQRKAFNEMLIKINKAMKDSPVFKEYGHNGESPEETPIQKRDKLVIELQKNDSSLKTMQARKMVYKQNPELYEAIQAEERA